MTRSALRPDLLLEPFPDFGAMADAAAEAIRSAAVRAVRARGRFTLALAGGSTPRGVYQRLAADRTLPWADIEFFFGDERAVPPDHPDSNARMVQQTLLPHGLARPERVHRIRAELPPADAAADYEATLRQSFAGERWPRLDLILLGLGSDGHTASLFPGSSALAERTRWVAATVVPMLGAARITLTFPLINAAADVLFLVSGRDKADALRATVARCGDVNVTPARGVQPSSGALRLIVDRDAASAL